MIHRRRWLALASAAVTSAALLPCWLSAEEGFEPIFDGKSLDGWEGDRKLWLAENGELVGRSPGIHYNDFLVHRERFSNFVLKLSVRLVNNAGNSGIQFRSERVPNSTEMYGYQADVGPGWWGNLYDASRRRRTLVEVPANERENRRLAPPQAKATNA